MSTTMVLNETLSDLKKYFR